jgi:hypothetical protein
MSNGIRVDICNETEGFARAGKFAEVAIFCLTAHTKNKEERDEFERVFKKALSEKGYELRGIPAI